jgi:septal ring factor EnvC (AmiA/AmiB activator)
MKRVFLSLSIALLLGFIYLAVVNINNSINLNYLHNVTNTQTFSLGIYTLISLFGGVFVGAGIVYMFLSAQKDKVKAYQRELERTSVSGINNASRVEVLEAKIKTLEKAFNTVADERTQLEVQIKNLNQEIDNITKNR